MTDKGQKQLPSEEEVKEKLEKFAEDDKNPKSEDGGFGTNGFWGTSTGKG